MEFIGGCVLVGHNLRFDVSFLDAALTRMGQPSARQHLRRHVRAGAAVGPRGGARLPAGHALVALPTRSPARRTERSTTRWPPATCCTCSSNAPLRTACSGSTISCRCPTMGGHPQAPKLRLTAQLPRAPGVYIFRDRAGRPLYVGKASNLRSRVRSYFSSDDRRKIGPMLRETHAIDHIVCHSTLEAAVLESRLIATHLPRYNRQGTGRRRYVYVKLTLNEAYPRLSVVRVPRADGGLYLGPIAVGASRATRRRRDRDALCRCGAVARRCVRVAPSAARRAPRPSSARRCARAREE